MRAPDRKFGRLATAWALALASSFAVAACAPKFTHTGDVLARAGDWETALAHYRQLAVKHPDDPRIDRRLERAERQVARLLTRRGHEANADGRPAEAGDWWRQAIALIPKDERAASAPFRAIDENLSALEYEGDLALAERRFDDSLRAFEAILAVAPERVEIVQKQMEAKQAYADELHRQAEDLAARNLIGAALVVDLRALATDPMQPSAFVSGEARKRMLQAKSGVTLSEPRIEDRGFRALAALLAAKLGPRIDDFPPYGRGAAGVASKASLVVTIEEFRRDETVREGTDELPNRAPPSKQPIPNPAIAAARALITERTRALTDRQAALKAALAAATRKRGARDGAEAKRAGLEAARAVDKARAELEAARATLASLPAKVPPPPPAPTWTLPWKETTRSVEARVTFAIVEPEFAEPVSLVITERVARTDREHAGNAAQSVEADPLLLPAFEALVEELGSTLGAGAKVIELARARRIGRLVEQGREHLAADRENEAIDAFVQVLFIAGPAALPGDARELLIKNLAHDRLTEIASLR